MSKEILQIPDSALPKIKNMSQVLNNPDLGKVLNQCINLTELLVNKLNRGDSVYIETRRGKTIELTLPGDF